MLTPEERQQRLEKIRSFPAQLEALVEYLDEDELSNHSIEDEWSVRQVVHHLADSHMNAYIRLKLMLTEDNPTIKPYDQAKWAELIDTATIPIDESLMILRGLHRRWVRLFENLQGDDWKRTAVHPESGEITPDSLLVTYSDHGDIHIDQINRVLAAQG